MNKKEIFATVVTVWIIATTGYVLYDQWSNYQINGVRKAYETAVNQVIAEVEKSGCQPFSIYSGQKKVELVDFECVKKEN